MPSKLLAAFGLVLLATTAGCARKDSPKAAPTPEAGYVVLATQAAPLEIELAGRTSAYETSDVRPQVSGLIQARRFEEGSIVKQGQTLYEIDPSLYRAAVSQAQANLANAEANRTAAQAKAARYKPLAAIEAVSKQDYTDAVAAAQQAAAQVEQMRAALQTAKINLAFTRVPAPIGGQVGRSLVTTGALVTSGQTGAMTTIARLDPIYVDIQQSSTDLVALRRQLASGGVMPSSATVRLVLEDGTLYPLPGRLEFTEPLVDPSTGSVTLRARFPNPHNLLLPGMFVRAQLSQATVRNAILAPQQAVSRAPNGDATVLVIGPDNKATLRQIKATRTVGDKWLVTDGLAAGERLITEGLIRIKPGQTVRPAPAGSPPSAPPPAPLPAAGR
ncbi:MAG TPA: efflux RND transporter periplasmic adaptor subunit [Phenylobacterium sp.]|uniref:efflux RND transporter periplasmic adaptor subunit n=1 Tax=Phenylobacterium sp. TaxID=1871053 RepID=UPI002B47F2DB|nr:efflux RND transporter periplasmic adaptor subunit [Phenylobacterium sp.]HKR86768.1 efflux RND transporter periplasmic adaptor subunit [Phenylobacterium sp.]HKT53480.1 efflux RND transporter periplasmic adaptor subunit [Caulobacteraceae bacterium]